MLAELRITNFAIIDQLCVLFDRGLNIITGETGAGKSIIIEAVGLLLGDRASAELIRSSEETAQVEAIFSTEGLDSLQQPLREMGIDPGDELFVRRVVSRSGRNRAYINGTSVTLAALSSLAESLINICSQHEHQAILNGANHIDILDEFGILFPLRQDFAKYYGRYLELGARMNQLRTLKAMREEKEEFLRFQLQELEAADVKAGEDQALSEEKKILSHSLKLRELSRSAHDALYARGGSVLEEFNRVISSLKEIHRIDPNHGIPPESCDSLYYQLEDMALTLRDYEKRLSHDPQRLNSVEDRLELLGRLKRKYGGSLERVLHKRLQIVQELSEMSSLEEEQEQLEQERGDCRRVLQQLAGELSRQRRKTGEVLAQAIEKEIHSLRMAGAGFMVVFEKVTPVEGNEGFNEKGGDQVEFYLQSNPGEDFKPLNRIASGGELSRIILAMKRALAATARTGTIVFDEVDSGIGGATAQTVGRKLREAAAHCQILCITHLPQIACYGHRHYRVEKKSSDGRTTTSVELLSEDQRTAEVARMLGGANITAKTIDHAREMLQEAREGAAVPLLYTKSS
ncbi:MAG: DNA repair protein RecN [Smithellaceae bacterium]|nr:DNA repair protein RecN [Smithellaceae bacterium]